MLGESYPWNGTCVKWGHAPEPGADTCRGAQLLDFSAPNSWQMGEQMNTGRDGSAPRGVFGWMRRLALLGLFLVPALAGCGGATGGDAGGTTAASDKGEVVIGLTDADGDFLTYQVDVVSLKLTRADGTTVETLPLSTTVDFAQYTDLTEFLTAATVPRGNYTGVTMTLDYSAADVQVEVGGVATPATVVDEAGDPLGVVDVSLTLEGDRPLKVKPGLPSQLVLDFNLAASNTVDLTDTAAPVVTVSPFLLASVDPDTTKPTRLRGLLKKVNVDAHLFQVRVLPFRLLTPDLHDRWGVFPVKTDADTAFEIDGVPYTGDEGLKALAGLPAGTPVVALGQVNRARRHMHASEVRAGTSVPWGDKDVVQGVVVARDGDTLTVKGAAVSFGDHVSAFRDTVTVLVGPDTVVTRLDADPDTLDAGAISVGQRIAAVGDLLPIVDMTADALATAKADARPLPEPIPVPFILPPVLDATEGYVRLEVSDLSGKVVEVGDTGLTVELRALNGRDPAIYDFTGTGGSETDDADPLNYQIDTGALALDGFAAGQAVKVRGFVTPFGAAPPDFEAYTLVSPALTVDGKALLLMSWDPATATPFTASGPDGVTLSLDGAGSEHHLVQRWRTTDLTLLGADPSIVPPDDGAGVFAIRLSESLHIYFTFAGFADAVDGYLADGLTAARLTSEGEWAADTTTLTSKVVALQMADAPALE